MSLLYDDEQELYERLIDAPLEAVYVDDEEEKQ